MVISETGEKGYKVHGTEILTLCGSNSKGDHNTVLMFLFLKVKQNFFLFFQVIHHSNTFFHIQTFSWLPQQFFILTHPVSKSTQKRSMCA